MKDQCVSQYSKNFFGRMQQEKSEMQWHVFKVMICCLLLDWLPHIFFVCKVPLWGWTDEGEIQPAGRAGGCSRPQQLWSLCAEGYRKGSVSSGCWCRRYLQYEWWSHDQSSLNEKEIEENWRKYSQHALASCVNVQTKQRQRSSKNI